MDTDSEVECGWGTPRGDSLNASRTQLTTRGHGHLTEEEWITAFASEGDRMSSILRRLLIDVMLATPADGPALSIPCTQSGSGRLQSGTPPSCRAG
jgi:hypothetical protein